MTAARFTDGGAGRGRMYSMDRAAQGVGRSIVAAQGVGRSIVAAQGVAAARFMDGGAGRGVFVWLA